MTASEFAFLALGLVLGVASGSALVMVVRSRPPSRLVRVTMERDAVPRRGATLSSDAFVTATAEPARGGPADRRHIDRGLRPSDPAPGPAPALVPIMARAPEAPANRTNVSFSGPAPAVGAVAIVAERDPAIDNLRVRAALAAERLYRDNRPTATALLEERATGVAVAPAPVLAPVLAPVPGVVARNVVLPLRLQETEDTDDAPETAIVRILRGDHQALFASTITLAGSDAAERRPWQAALLGLARSLSREAIRQGWLDVPSGNAFWDTFTLDQCRLIAAALASAGYLFDGTDGWTESRVPAYRDLAAAVAAAGLEPRRLRAWPTQDEIERLYGEVKVAGGDFLAVRAPSLDLVEIQALVEPHRPELAPLWVHWDRVRAVLLGAFAA